jgi:hypothetical protein
MDGLGRRLALALSLSLAAVACAAPTIPNDSGEDPNSADSDVTATKAPKKTTTPKKDTTTPPEGDNTTPAPSPTPTPTPTPTPNACAGKTGDACFDCCNEASGGTLGPADEAFGQCACGDAGACTGACGADFCTGAAPSATCQQCLTATCDPKADALCTSAACKAGQQCASQCQ